MRYVFIAASILMLIKVALRKPDFYSVGIVCHILYNIHCATGRVFITGPGIIGHYYYYSIINRRAYFIVLLQMLMLFVFVTYHDLHHHNEKNNPLICDKYNEETEYALFLLLCLIAWAIMLYNITRIGVSNLNANKSYIWTRISSLYTTSCWMGMAIFTYSIKKKKYLLAIAGAMPVLLHFFFGSRAYFATLCILFLVLNSGQIKNSLVKNVKLYILGALGVIFILAYKRVYMAMRMGDFAGAMRVFTNPDTYAYVFRMGEPRIVLTHLNYIIDNNIKLGWKDLADRLISVIPFAGNLIGEGSYQPVSTLLRESYGSDSGLASNIWGEFYAIGSYPLVMIMFVFWLRILKWGNTLIKREDWTSNFCMPLVGYFSFYIHRMDFVKAMGNAKRVLLAMIIFLLVSVVVTHNSKLYVSRRIPQK